MVLLAAMMLLLLGETLLQERLKGLVFVCYWLVCIVCTGLAILAALLDVLALKHRTRQEHRALLNDALQEIEAKAKKRAERASANGDPARRGCD